MAFLQELSHEEIQQAIELLADNALLLSLTVPYQGRWVTFRSRAIAQLDGVFWVEKPRTDRLLSPHKYRPGDRVGVSFSLSHRKYVFAARLICTEVYAVEAASQSTALRLAVPEKMQKVERRLHNRLQFSQKEVSLAKFWLGGHEAQPAQASVEAPIWSGRILNVSAGGLLVDTTADAASYLEVGDIVGVHFTLAGDDQAYFVDAQVRHCVEKGELAQLGMQFVEVEEEPVNREAIERIRRRIAEQLRERRLSWEPV